MICVSYRAFYQNKTSIDLIHYPSDTCTDIINSVDTRIFNSVYTVYYLLPVLPSLKLKLLIYDISDWNVGHFYTYTCVFSYIHLFSLSLSLSLSLTHTHTRHERQDVKGQLQMFVLGSLNVRVYPLTKDM